MRTKTSRNDLLSRAIVAAAFVIALGGFTEGSCFGTDQDGEPCGETTCAAGERCEMQEFDCTTAPCPSLPTCVPAQPTTECFSDSDCGQGEYCDYSDAFPEDYQPDPTNCIAMSGVCRPVSHCNSNADCAIDEHCEFGPQTRCDAECEPGTECRCGGLPVDGTCEPGPAECYSDADCPGGTYCPLELMVDCACAEGEDCPYDCGVWGPTFCQPLPEHCSSDADCAPEEFCNLGTTVDPDDYCDCGPNGDCYCGAPAPAGLCEPRNHPGECETDADCGPGALCSFIEVVCPADPATGEPGCFEQIGVCIYEPRPECQTDADCIDGQSCVLYEVDCVCADGSDMCDCGAPIGNCEWLPADDCQTDADCRPDQQCVFYDVDCLCAGEEGAPCDCGPTAGICEPRPGEGCQTDADCGPGGLCEHFATCAAIGCPPAPPSQCVYPACDDGSPLLCDGIAPTCAAGQVAAVRNSCWECVDARTCATEPPPPDTCWGAWTDEAGVCRAPNDGTLPPECCNTACQVDSDCGPDATCWDGLCVAEPQTGCPGEGDPRVSYVCTGRDCWVIGAWICPEGQEMFSNACGGGCIDEAICPGRTEWECQADALCQPLYGPSHCDPATGVCTADEGFLACERGF